MGWLYEQSKYLFKADPNTLADEYQDFSRQVITATVEMSKNPAGKVIVEKFRQIKFMIDIVATNGEGFFVPYCDDAQGIYELPDRGDTGAVIVWDPTKTFAHKNTANGSEVVYPSWVILAHEMGHAIQLSDSGKPGKEWLHNYSANQAQVEMDNVAKHETPIVASLGLEPRVRYM